MTEALMETLILFLKGAAIGFVLAAPVGPVGVICVQRTLRHGRVAGFIAGLGAAWGDALYGAVAAFGLTLVSDWLTDHQNAVSAVGCVVLLVLGLRMLLVGKAQSGDEHGPIERTVVEANPDVGMAQAFGSTFALTVTNPVTILSFFGLFAFAGTGDLTDKHQLALVLVGGVFIGSALWWAIIALGAGHLRKHLQGDGTRWVNRISGALMLAFASYFLWRLTLAIIENPSLTVF